MSLQQTLEYMEDIDETYRMAVELEKKEFTFEEKIDFIMERIYAIDTLLPILIDTLKRGCKTGKKQ